MGKVFTPMNQHFFWCKASKDSNVQSTPPQIKYIYSLGLLSPVGNLTNTEVDHCTLHFTWTAPYTLQGVPINYYNITITRHSDGAVLGSYTTNTTEFLYNASRLGETLEVVVAAVNDAGMGKISNSSAAGEFL